MKTVRRPDVSPRRRKTRERLIEAAIPLFAAKGVAGASIEELCEAAGMTRGAFYSNFDSRDELILAVCDHAITAATGAVDELASDDLEAMFEAESTALDEKSALAHAVMRFFADYSDAAEWVLAEAEIELHALRVPELREAYAELVQAHYQQIGAVIGSLLARVGGRVTIPLDELVALLATVTRQASKNAVPSSPAPDARLDIDPSATIRILQAFTEFG